VFLQSKDLEFTFDGLVHGITYKFQVNTVNEIGSGIKSEIIIGTSFGVFASYQYLSQTQFQHQMRKLFFVTTIK